MHLLRGLGDLRRKFQVLARVAREARNPAQYPKYLAAAPATDAYTLVYSPPTSDAALPVPPPELWLDYATEAKEYLASGQRHVRRMLEIAPFSSPDADQSQRVLDLGCGGGRMIRHLVRHAQNGEIWGVDISAKHINWLKTHLSPPFWFATTTTIPHLPFADGYFDYVYCGSLFTHIEDLAEAWVLEVARVLRSGGCFYCTMHDEDTVRILLRDRHPFGRVIAYSSENLGDVRVVGRDTHSNVFYSSRYLRHVFSAMFQVERVQPEAYGYQTAWVLRRH